MLFFLCFLIFSCFSKARKAVKRFPNRECSYTELTLFEGRGWHVLRCHADAPLVCHMTEIQYGIAHTSQCRIDAAMSLFGDFLERKFIVNAHEEHFTLWLGKKGDETSDLAERLLVYHLSLAVFVDSNVRIIEEVYLLFVVLDNLFCGQGAVVVNEVVMDNAHHP